MRRAVLLLILGLILAVIGFMEGGWFLIASWLGLNFLAVGIAHLKGWHRIFGKRSNGTLPSWGWLLFLPLLLYTSAVWHLMRIFSREPARNTVTPDLVVGRRLRASELQEQFANFVDLTSEFVEPASIRKSPGYVCVPILDGSAPDPEVLLAEVKKLRPGRTFIHCAQGHGRTGLFATAFLVAHRKARTVDEALAILRNVRPRIRLSRAQRECIDRLAAIMQVGGGKI
jgi:protein-tyrosine phosphatase